MNAHTMIRNAHVEANVVNSNQMQIIINDEFEHTFDETSRYSKALRHFDANDIAKRLCGGNFFFIGERLSDFREEKETSFIHSDDNIVALMQHIGARVPTSREKIQFNSNGRSGVLLNKHWSADEFHAEGYQDGGVFSTNVSFTWSPFHDYVRGVFQIVRQVCSNGMVALGDIVNSRVPLVNRWAEHLDIAAHQLQNKAGDVISKRVKMLQFERATLRELMTIAEHASARLQSEENVDHMDVLANIRDIADPTIHAATSYSMNAFDDSHLASFLPGHLTAFDAWNLVTEMNSHTHETDSSSVTALQRLANGMVFNKRNNHNYVAAPSSVRLSAFSDPNAAFFGIMQ